MRVVRPRDGLVTLCVLVCLLVSSSLAVLALQASLRTRREVTITHQMMQTERLLDAGIQRAVLRLRQSPEYEGETWTPEDSISNFPRARVTIQVEDLSNYQALKVVASLGHRPDGVLTPAPGATQSSYTVRIQRPTDSTSE